MLHPWTYFSFLGVSHSLSIMCLGYPRGQSDMMQGHMIWNDSIIFEEYKRETASDV